MKIWNAVIFFSLPFSLFLTSPGMSDLKPKLWDQDSLTDPHSIPRSCHFCTSTPCKSDTSPPQHNSPLCRILKRLSTAFQINSRPLSPDLRSLWAAPTQTYLTAFWGCCSLLPDPSQKPFPPEQMPWFCRPLDTSCGIHSQFPTFLCSHWPQGPHLSTPQGQAHSSASP